MANALTPTSSSLPAVPERFANPLRQIQGVLAQPAVRRAGPMALMVGLLGASALAWSALSAPPQKTRPAVARTIARVSPSASSSSNTSASAPTSAALTWLWGGRSMVTVATWSALATVMCSLMGVPAVVTFASL